ncbi:helix-turn-helix domain-containing protein [Motiliproteus sp.]|uniref:helix-turn-helix domain-containing protein n=1 Tax=Motiliproteus sp. TaxID=1898955 RepID=UPI003BAC146B
MAESLSSQDSVEETLGQPNPGGSLRQAREQQQLTLEEVSERLKLTVSQLKALENGEMDKLPGLAFVRGYLRGYGKLLGLDADQLVEDFNALHGGTPQSRVTSINRVKPQAQMGDPMLRISVVIFVLALLGTSIWWWQTQMGADAQVPLLDQSQSEVESSGADTSVLRGSVGSDDTMAESDSNQPDPSVGVAADATPADDAVVEEQSDSEPEPRYLSDEEIAALARQMEQESQTPTSEPPAQVEPQPTTGSSETAETGAEPLLLVRFKAECWVSIKTTDGKTIFASLMQAGNVLERKLDNLPVELLLGQSASVETAEFRGLPLPVDENSNKGVARLTLE